MPQKSHLLPLACAFAMTVSQQALAAPFEQPRPKANNQSLSASLEAESFSQGLGDRRAATLDYRLEGLETTLTFTTTAGERKIVGADQRSVGGGMEISHSWSSDLTSRTKIFASQDRPVFARFDLAQDLTLRLQGNNTVTAGARLASYHGGEEVRFLSAGARHYFRGGSIAYRASLVDTDGRSSFMAHLVNLAVKDGRGIGQTRLWLSAGEASFNRLQPGSFSGKDLGAVVQRLQPLSGPLAFTVTAGVNSYARPGRDIRSTTFGLGLSTTFSDAD